MPVVLGEPVPPWGTNGEDRRPVLQTVYSELAVHYDTLVDPARAAKPKDKAQVEPSQSPAAGTASP